MNKPIPPPPEVMFSALPESCSTREAEVAALPVLDDDDFMFARKGAVASIKSLMQPAAKTGRFLHFG